MSKWRCQDYSVEKGQSPQQMVLGKLDIHKQKNSISKRMKLELQNHTQKLIQNEDWKYESLRKIYSEKFHKLDLSIIS